MSDKVAVKLDNYEMHWDRLSDLPLPLIHHILSFLPINDVVKTTLLSKHWVNLWTTVPCLNICLNDEEDRDNRDVKNERFRKLVNGALRLWKGTKILKFSISIGNVRAYDFESLVDDVRAWTLFALKHEVEELNIKAFPEYSVPHDVYSCSVLRRLSLWNRDIDFHGTPSWNQLKSLSLSTYHCKYPIRDLVNQIMLGSPVLEVFELHLEDLNCWNLNIMSTSLKRLKIVCREFFLKDGTSLDTLSICCPNLNTLEIKGLFKCLFADVSSLTNATLDFCNKNCKTLTELLGENLKQIFTSIQNVEKLALTDLFVQAFGVSRKEYLFLPLPNVKFLKLDGDVCLEYGDVIDLLGIFPNLKYFIFGGRAFRQPHVFNIVNYMEFETNISKSFLLQLKIVEINGDPFHSSFFGLIEFLLKHAVMLEKLVIWPKGTTLRQHKRFLEKLLSMPKSSSTARVILKSD